MWISSVYLIHLLLGNVTPERLGLRSRTSSKVLIHVLKLFLKNDNAIRFREQLIKYRNWIGGRKTFCSVCELYEHVVTMLTTNCCVKWSRSVQRRKRCKIVYCTKCFYTRLCRSEEHTSELQSRENLVC